MNDTAEAGDFFGNELAAANFGAGWYADLAVGITGENIGGDLEAGAVQVMYGSPNGLSVSASRGDQFFTQDSPNINGAVAQGDRFGRVAAANFGAGSQADLAIGAAGEAVSGVELAGGVAVIYGSANGLSATAARPDQLWTQNSPNIADMAEHQDGFGAAVAAVR